jgi:hypothetical protein
MVEKSRGSTPAIDFDEFRFRVNLLRARSLNSQMPLRSVHFVLVVGK